MSKVEARIQDILNHTSHQVRPQYLLSDIKEAVEVIERLRCILDRIAELEAALRSIARNTCCDRCQEAALVARAALGEKE